MFSKTSFVFLVTLAIAQGIVIGNEPTDRPEDRLQHSDQIMLRDSVRDKVTAFINIMKLLMPLNLIRILKFVLTAGMHLLVFYGFIGIFNCFTKDHITFCKDKVAEVSHKYMTPRNIHMASIIVHEAVKTYEHHLSQSTESIETIQSKPPAVELKRDYEVEQSTPDEEDNETTSYI